MQFPCWFFNGDADLEQPRPVPLGKDKYERFFNWSKWMAAQENLPGLNDPRLWYAVFNRGMRLLAEKLNGFFLRKMRRAQKPI